MSVMSYSARLRDLSKNYYQSHIGYEEYRRLRKEVLDKIDEEFNGRKPASEAQAEESGTESGESSLLMKTVAFFKNKDIEE